MASAGGMRPLVRKDVESLASKATGSRALAGMYLVLPKDEEHPDVVSVAAAFLVYVRSGGFMVVVPPDEGVRLALARLEDPVSDAPVALHSGEVALESSRGRSVGVGDVELVDLPWDAVGGFISAGSLRGAALREAQVVAFHTTGGDSGGYRPAKEAVQTLADGWIVEGLDNDAAQDYVTGEELSDPELQIATPQASGAQVLHDNEVAQLKQRIAELESAAASRPPMVAASAALKASPKAGQLFAPMQGAAQSSLTAADWSKLQMLAGSPPPRVGVGEKRRGRVPDTVRELEGAFANLEKEAEDPDEVPDLLAVLKEESTDPVHKLLAVQLRQNQALLEKLVGQKHSDPVLGALTGGETSSGSSSGVKGCLARDAFIKAMQDLPKVVRVTRQQALKELGMGEDREDGSILRRYMERKVPLADHRLLSYMAAMLAECWSVGYQSQNVELLGMTAKMFYFVEQCAIDGGKCQLAWLLTGFQEPAFHLLTNQRRQTGLQPFARLCSPAWIAANISYIKDLDYLESRMQSMGKPPKPPPGGGGDGAPTTNPGGKPDKPPKGGGKKKKESAVEESSA